MPWPVAGFSIHSLAILPVAADPSFFHYLSEAHAHSVTGSFTELWKNLRAFNRSSLQIFEQLRVNRHREDGAGFLLTEVNRIFLEINGLPFQMHDVSQALAGKICRQDQELPLIAR